MCEEKTTTTALVARVMLDHVAKRDNIAHFAFLIHRSIGYMKLDPTSLKVFSRVANRTSSETRSSSLTVLGSSSSSS